MIQAPFRCGIEIEDYQLDPVVRAEQMPRANILIADDVGLSKTITAGLVLQELIIRQRVRTVLIVCPAALQIQWLNLSKSVKSSAYLPSKNPDTLSKIQAYETD